MIVAAVVADASRVGVVTWMRDASTTSAIFDRDSVQWTVAIP